MEATEVSIKQENAFFEGVKAGVSIAIGYLPIALTFGLLAKGSGLLLMEAVAMSFFVFAGAAQYISLILITAGTSSLEIILTTFIVNIRHFLMGMAINEKSANEKLILKLTYAFGLTDETFTVAMTKNKVLRAQFMFGLITISFSSWVFNTALGHLIGANLPNALQQSMGIALFAMFIGLLVPAVRKNAKYLVLAITAAFLNSIFVTILGDSGKGWAIVLATIISAVMIELVWKGEVHNE
jgi:4-azaleucine resistance transporter AzlC